MLEHLEKLKPKDPTFEANPPSIADSRAYLRALSNTSNRLAHPLWAMERVRDVYGPPNRIEADEDEPGYELWLYSLPGEEEFYFDFVEGYCTSSG